MAPAPPSTATAPVRTDEPVVEEPSTLAAADAPSAATSTNEGTLGAEHKAMWEQVALALFIAIPFAALVAAIPLALRGGWLSWRDIVIAAVFYTVAGHGVTIGFHRLFTHRAFKANRALTIALAIAGSLAIQGPVVRWVADHRKHHKFSDKEGDPHSPWAHGESVWGLTRGFMHAHIGWLFDVEQTPQKKYAPDLLKDADVVRVSRMFPLWVAVSMLAPAVIGGLWSWSWHGALTAFFWGSLVRVGLLHHTTWSVNSICHMVGDRPFKSRDRSGNVWWLCILSQGESWHNLHHADPTAARHGVLRGQLDTSARMIWLFEKFGWVRDVRWPSAERIASKRVEPNAA